MRIVLFVDPAMANGMDLLVACLRLAARRGELEPVAIVDTALAPASRLQLPRTRAAWALRRLLNVNTPAEPLDAPPRASVASLARRRRIPVLAPRAAGVNDPSFVEALERLQPDVGLSLMVGQMFRAPLLAACGTPVNYHPGLLPDYQGVDPTAWSIYRGEPTSGFSFHLMNEQIDRGPILLQGAVALAPARVTAPVEREKTRLARSRLNELFDLLAAPLVGARRQDRPGSSFTRADGAAIRDVAEPRRLTLAELELRLRAFEIVDLTLSGQRWRTTALRRVRRRARGRRLAFTTADGVVVEPSRVLHLPPVAYRALLPAIRSA